MIEAVGEKVRNLKAGDRITGVFPLLHRSSSARNSSPSASGSSQRRCRTYHWEWAVIEAVGEKVRNLKAGDRIICPVGFVNAPGYHITWGGMNRYAVTHDIRAMIEDGQALVMMAHIYDRCRA